MTRNPKPTAVVLLQALAERLAWPATAGGRAGAAHQDAEPAMSDTKSGAAPARTPEEELQAQLAILQLVAPTAAM